MAQATNIEWTEQVWNFLRGCRRVSEGCTNCYAERQAIRHSGPGGSYEGLVKSTPNGPRWTGEISFHEDILLAPLKRKKPTTYFVNSMSDLFYEKVKDEWLDKAFAVMALTPQHTYQILTKRPERMLEYLTTESKGDFPNSIEPRPMISYQLAKLTDLTSKKSVELTSEAQNRMCHGGWPLPNVWLGVSVEDQKTHDERAPLLLDTPAAVRWLSLEPLLGPVTLTGGPHHRCDPSPHPKSILSRHDTKRRMRSGASFYLNAPLRGIDWAVVGGESGPRARPCDTAWIRSIVEQCQISAVPVFVKQLGASPVWRCDPECVDPAQAKLAEEYGVEHDATVCACRCHERLLDRKGGDIAEWPEDLCVRQMPEVSA